MRKEYGAVISKNLQKRLADLRAASCVTDLVAGRPHALKYDLKEAYAVDLTNMIRLIFRAANSPIPRKPDETVDWKDVTMIEIEKIEDYHE
jgi:proteic killer suppression protein